MKHIEQHILKMADALFKAEPSGALLELMCLIAFATIYWSTTFPTPTSTRTGLQLPSRQNFLKAHLQPIADSEANDNLCIICRDHPTSPVRILHCRHVLCQDCANAWFSSRRENNRCPRCQVIVHIKETNGATLLVAKLINTTWALYIVLGLLVLKHATGYLDTVLSLLWILTGLFFQVDVLAIYYRLKEIGTRYTPPETLRASIWTGIWVVCLSVEYGCSALILFYRWMLLC